MNEQISLNYGPVWRQIRVRQISYPPLPKNRVLKAGGRKIVPKALSTMTRPAKSDVESSPDAQPKHCKGSGAGFQLSSHSYSHQLDGLGFLLGPLGI